MKLIHIAAIALIGFAGSLSAQEKGSDKVSAALKGKLIAAKEGKVTEAKLTGDPEYYVLYHSASW